MSVDVGQLLQEHSKLFSHPMTVLGELHYRILKSVKITEDKKEKDNEFAREIGRDEIHWWIFYKETDRGELKLKTEEVLESSQKLKEDSIRIRDSLRPKLYSKLIEDVKNFCIEHQETIQNVLNYVIWLEEKNPSAPSILFTYRVWGSTRMGDRTIRLHNKDEKAAINKCIEIALGLRNFSRGAVVGSIFNDISYEICQSLDPEYYDKPIVISEDAVASRSSTEILREMAEYFEFLRNSFRNILLEIGEYEISDNILHNNDFWKSFVRKVMELPVETMMWDFKETLAMWETKGTMKKKKEVEFCEDIASFANRHAAY